MLCPLNELQLTSAIGGSRIFFVDIFFVDLVVVHQIEVERIFAMRVDHVLLPISAREIDRVRVFQIVTNLDPEVPIVAAVAERVRVDDTAVNGFDVNFVRHERQSSIGAGKVEGSDPSGPTAWLPCRSIAGLGELSAIAHGHNQSAVLTTPPVGAITI